MEKTVVVEEYAKKKCRRQGTLKKYGLALAFLSPFVVAFVVFFLFPFFYGIYISLTNFKYGSPGKEILNGFKWYSYLFDPSAKPLIFESFWRAFLHSFIFSLIMVPIAVVVPFFLAVLVHLKPPGYKLFRSLIYLPSIVPLTAAGTVFTMLFLPSQTHGLLAELFPNLGPHEWFIDSWFTFNLGSVSVDVAYAWIPIFLMCFWGGWGGNFLILSAGLENVPKSLYEAASIDGCNHWQKTIHVTIPNIKGQLVLCLFTTIIGYLGLYGQNYVLVQGGPIIARLSSMPAGGKTSTIIYFIQDIVANNSNFKSTLYGLGAAASLVFALMVGTIAGLQMWLTRDKKTGTRTSEDYQRWLSQK